MVSLSCLPGERTRHVSHCTRATDVSARDGTVSGSWWHVHPQPGMCQPGEERRIHRNSLPYQAALPEQATILPYAFCLFFFFPAGLGLKLRISCLPEGVLLPSYNPTLNIMFLTLNLSGLYIIKSQAPSYTTGEWQKPSP